MIDNKTSRLELPLPNPDNLLDDDVERIIAALEILDSAATVGADGRIPDSQIPVGVARRGSPEFTGIPKSPTALPTDSGTQIANTRYVTNAVSTAKLDILGSPPADLNTLEKIALSLYNNPNFAEVIDTALSLRAMNDDSRLDTINGKSGGTVSNRVNIGVNITGWGTGVYTDGEARTYQYISQIQKGVNWQVEQYGVDVQNDHFEYRFLVNKLGNIKTLAFRQDNGNASVPGTFVSGSDIRHKSNLAFVDNALSAVCSFRGMIYDKKDGTREVGLIAQDVEKECPSAITEVKREFSDGVVIEDFKMLNTSGVSAAYHTEAIKDIIRLMKLMLDDPDGARIKIDALCSSMNDQIG